MNGISEGAQNIAENLGQETAGGTPAGTQQQARPDGTISKETTSSVADAVAPSALPGLLENVPPEIMHVTEGYLPLSKLLNRMTQECFNDLNELVNDLSQIKVSDQDRHALVNGVGGSSPADGAGNTSAENFQKRSRMMHFASHHRERFMKMFVLQQWSRNVEDVSKVIDLNFWFRQQTGLYDETVWQIGELKRSLAGAKLPAPDIKTALEVLSTGRASWMPDLGYVPIEPLSPQKILKTLRDLNTTLHIRLHLHEELPRHFNKFVIASGRATFTVPTEFEADFSIADEDVTSQFYFVDFRFLFSPASEIPDGQLRYHLEERANFVLKEHGLAGCYDLLHNFVLTHKVNVLRKQALSLARFEWAGAIRVEPIHRSLIVQYWLDRAGPKSYIEIGIASGKRKSSWKGEAVPYVALKWICAGKEVKDAQIAFDLKTLSVEDVLRSIVALHLRSFLQSVQERLAQTPMFVGRKGALVLRSSGPDPIDMGLDMRSPGSGDVLSLVVEPVTGRIFIQPPSAHSNHIENELNTLKDASVDGVPRLLNLHCLTMQAAIENQAARAGWSLIRTLNIKPESVKQNLGTAVSLLSGFKIRSLNSSSWVMVATVSLVGEAWWAVELAPTIPGMMIVNALRLSPDQKRVYTNTASTIWYDALEGEAVANVSLFVMSRALKQFGIPHCFDDSVVESGDSTSYASEAKFPTLNIKLSSLLRMQGVEIWAGEFVRLSHHGFEEAKDSNGVAKVVHMVNGVLKSPISINKNLTSSTETRIAVRSSGALAVLVKTPLGSPMVDEVVESMKSMERLCLLLKEVRTRQYETETVSLDQIAFTYGSSFGSDRDSSQPKFRAQLDFAHDGAIHLSLSPSANPHCRIQSYLEAMLSCKTASKFRDFAYHLEATLPLLRALDTIQDRHSHLVAQNTVNPLKRKRSGSMSEASSTQPPEVDPAVTTQVAILSRSATHYVLRYAFPSFSRTFSIQLRQRDDELCWHVQDTQLSSSSTNRSPASEEDNAEISSMFTKSMSCKGKGWNGLSGSGFAATDIGIQEVVLKIDDLMTRYKDRVARPSGSGFVPHAIEQKMSTGQEGRQAPEKKKKDESMEHPAEKGNMSKNQAAAAAATPKDKLANTTNAQKQQQQQQRPQRDSAAHRTAHGPANGTQSREYVNTATNPSKAGAASSRGAPTNPHNAAPSASQGARKPAAPQPSQTGSRSGGGPGGGAATTTAGTGTGGGGTGAGGPKSTNGTQAQPIALD